MEFVSLLIRPEEGVVTDREKTLVVVAVYEFGRVKGRLQVFSFFRTRALFRAISCVSMDVPRLLVRLFPAAWAPTAHYHL